MNSQPKQRWADRYPELGTGPIETESLISKDAFERERERVFKRTWLKVGRVEELPKPGDYKVKRIAVGPASVILVRGKDDRIRAFHNVCSHRANKVVTETGEETFGSSRAAVMTCRFHGWVYNAEGQIVAVPEEERFSACFAKEENGLAPVHCDVWAGFIFINLDEGTPKPLSEFIGGFDTHLGSFPYEKYSHCFSYMTELNCNWKIGVDAFAEAYHVPTIHSGTFPLASIDLEDVQLMGDHRTGGIYIDLTEPPTPTAQIAQRLSRSSLVEQVADADRLPPSINPHRRPNFIFELSVVFPNFLIHVSDGIWFTHQFWPLSENRTLWEGKYYVSPPTSYAEQWGVEHAQILQRNAWLEDTATMEATQEALETRVKSKMFLQDDEVLLRHAYHVLEKYTGDTEGVR